MRPLTSLALCTGLLAALLPPLAAYGAATQTPVAPPPPPAAAEDTTLRTGWVVMELDSGKVLSARNQRDVFIPASVAKLPAALAALDLLGADRRFLTTVAATGPVKKGIVQGDLVLIGGGDPTLDVERMTAMVETLKGKGIKGISGRFLYDETALPQLPHIDGSQPPDASYNPGLGALSLDFNRIRVKVAPNGTVSAVDLPLNPLPAQFVLPPQRPEDWLPVRDPGLFAARSFRLLAGKRGITLPAPQTVEQPIAGAQVLVAEQSAPLADILRDALHYSNNMTLETVALAATGAADLESAGAKLSEVVRKDVPAVSWADFVLPNASGLSPRARMSPGQCTAIVRRFATKTMGDVALNDLMPGVLTEPFAASDPSHPSLSPLRAKTGTIYYGRALAGIAETASGRRIAFCVMTDDQKQRAAYDGIPIAERVGDAVRSAARDWLKAAREKEEALVEGWIATY